MSPTAVAKDRAGAALAGELLDGLEGQIDPVRVSPLYRLAAAAVVAAMVLLPVVYLALIAAVAYGLWYHVTQNAEPIFAGHGNAKGKVAIYVAPIIAGGTLLLFLVKPLLAPRPKTGRPHELDEERHPVFFEFVRRIAEIVGAPRPRRIHVDCQVNASASFRRGLLSFLGRDVVLTVGLPLAGGLSVRQLAGVLAHEMGHFGQGSGMRLTYVVRRVSGWFARVVYERDEWDVRLVAACKSGEGWISALAWVARACVWVARRILWVLMSIGHALSCFLLRQMEFDADQYEARVAGGDAFEATFERLVTLSVASQGAHADLATTWREQRLCDDFPALVQANVRMIPGEIKRRLDEDRSREKTGLFDTHPCDRDRIAAVRAQTWPGLARCDRPASDLFHNFPDLCRQATTAFYAEVLGNAVAPTNLVTTETVVQHQDALAEQWNAQKRYFQGLLLAIRPLAADAPAPPADRPAEQVLARLRQLREEILRAAPAAREALRRFDEADTTLLNLAQAEALRQAKQPLRPGKNCAPLDYSQGVLALENKTRQEQAAAETVLPPVFAAASARLAGALALLDTADFAPRVPDRDALRAEAGRLKNALSTVRNVYGICEGLRFGVVRLGALLGSLEGNEEKKDYVDRVLDRSAGLAAILTELRRALGDAPYPFPHALGAVRLADFVVEAVPERSAVGQMADVSQTAVSRVYEIYNRAMARLAAIAETIEKAGGLEPLPAPPEPAPAPSSSSSVTDSAPSPVN